MEEKLHDAFDPSTEDVVKKVISINPFYFSIPYNLYDTPQAIAILLKQEHLNWLYNVVSCFYVRFFIAASYF